MPATTITVTVAMTTTPLVACGRVLCGLLCLLLLLRRVSCVSGTWPQVHINGGNTHQPGERDWHGAECGGVKQFDG